MMEHGGLAPTPDQAQVHLPSDRQNIGSASFNFDAAGPTGNRDVQCRSALCCSAVHRGFVGQSGIGHENWVPEKECTILGIRRARGCTRKQSYASPISMQ